MKELVFALIASIAVCAPAHAGPMEWNRSQSFLLASQPGRRGLDHKLQRNGLPCAASRSTARLNIKSQLQNYLERLS